MCVVCEHRVRVHERYIFVMHVRDAPWNVYFAFWCEGKGSACPCICICVFVSVCVCIGWGSSGEQGNICWRRNPSSPRPRPRQRACARRACRSSPWLVFRPGIDMCVLRECVCCVHLCAPVHDLTEIISGRCIVFIFLSHLTPFVSFSFATA